MSDLSIKTKVFAVLAATLTVTFTGILIINSRHQDDSMSELYRSSVNEIQTAVTEHMSFMMLSGANEEIQPIVERLTSENVMNEIVIVNADRIVSRSSDERAVGKVSDDPLWERLFRNGKDTVFETTFNDEPALVKYKVFENNDACADCHDPNTEKILGGVKMVKSKQAMEEALAANFTVVAAVSVLGGLILIVGIIMVLQRNVFSPLSSVQTKLERAANGDLNQRMIIRTNDEIGQLLTSIQNLMDYMEKFADASERIAGGDLRVEVTPINENDHLGNAFKKMIANLTVIVGQLRQNSEKLTGAAAEIASSSEQMARGADSQSDQVTQVATSIEQMTATIIESSQNAGNARNAARGASETAGQGGRIVSDNINGMHRIAEVVRESSASIARLAKSADQIGEIVRVIDEIADQTNLLALNAAIEAARAGEQGRGFAVVADEVRKLAERTGQATGEITDMIKGIQTQTTQAVESMESGIQEVDQGRELADHAGKSLTEIVTMSERVMMMIEQIATASEQQSAAAETISQNIEQIAWVTRETAAGAEQSATSAEQLSEQADALQKIVNQFRTEG